MSRRATKRLTPAQGSALQILAGRNAGMGPDNNVSAEYFAGRDIEALISAGMLEGRGSRAGKPVVSVTDAGRAALNQEPKP